MLRNLAIACRKVYTCTCAPKRFSEQSTIGVVCHSQKWIHSGVALNTLDKELRSKKRLIIMADEAKQEQLQDIEGFSEKGITIPTPDTTSMLVDGVRFDELPIIMIKSSLNNTIMTITTHDGDHLHTTSCGKEGFRHVKKSTNVAAQATGLSLGQTALKKGVTSVRVIVKGLGAGRLASMKGLQMAGVNIVSITDNTPVPHNGPRPRKAKRH